jgi:hypothetical protein
VAHADTWGQTEFIAQQMVLIKIFLHAQHVGCKAKRFPFASEEAQAGRARAAGRLSPAPHVGHTL